MLPLQSVGGLDLSAELTATYVIGLLAKYDRQVYPITF